ncbi:uncharacterized protein LOC326903 [Tachysurus ichikawai]
MTKISKLHSKDIRVLRSAGKSTLEINRHLNSVGEYTTLSTIRRHYKERTIIKRKPRKITEDIVTAIENRTCQNDEMAASSVKKQLWRDKAVDISERSICRVRQRLGWRYR